MSHPLTVWWGIPCKSAIPVFRALAEEHGLDVLFVSVNDLPPRRKQLGWSIPDPGEMPLIVLDAEDWQSRVAALMDERGGLHIVNGIYHDDRVRYVAHRLAEQDQKFGVIMEAPSNLEDGIRRIAKSVIAPMVTPMRTRAVARKAQFVLSASGNRQADFEDLGFARDRIFPFGYFPDFPYMSRAPQGDPSLRMLCIGYLEPFKGQDCLLKALSLLKARNVPIECTITGFGSAKERLEALSRQLGLSESVMFAGVVSNERLLELFAYSNVLVAPGLEEPWGIRINEALLSGLPVVVSDGVGAKELIEASGAGEVFRAGSAISLAGALERCFERLHGEDDLMQTVTAFRTLITPGAVAYFLAEVIRFVQGQGSRDREALSTRPTPPWADRDWRAKATSKLGAA